MVTNQASNLKELLAKDEQFLSGALYRIFHIVVERGEGPYLFTVDGEKYLDLTSGIGVTQLGHCYPEVVKAAQNQLEKLVHINGVTHHVETIKLAERLAKILPGNLDNTFFCNSGAEAVEGALKLAKHINPGRPNVIAFRGSFHGRTLATTSISSSKVSLRKNYDPILSGVNFVDYPTDTKKTIEEINKMFKLHLPPESVFAIIIEPILGEGGYLPSPPDFLKELRKLCDEHKIVLICDEVQSGIGRTGRWFGCENYNVTPDIITMAKGIANGLPMGAFSSTKKHMSLMPPGSHGSTFGGNAVVSAASNKTLEIIERDNILTYVSKTGEELISYLKKELKEKVQVRGLGFMIGLEFESKDKTKKIVDECFTKEKILLLTAGAEQKTIRLIPSLNIEKNILFNVAEKIIAIIKKST